MKVSSFIARTALFFKYFFSFKRPEILQFEFVDVVLEEKTLFLLSWKFARRYYLSIPELRKFYVVKYGSIVLKVPSHINCMEITISTSWRKKKFKLYLKKVSIEKEVADFLLLQFKPLKMLQFKKGSIHFKKKLGTTKMPVLSYGTPILQLKQKNLSVKTEGLIYSKK